MTEETKPAEDTTELKVDADSGIVTTPDPMPETPPDVPVVTFSEEAEATPEPSPLEKLRAAGKLEWRTTDGILTTKRTATIEQAAAIVQGHFGIAADKWRADVLAGAVQVKDTDDDKIYSGKGLARILGIDGGGTGTTPAT